MTRNSDRPDAAVVNAAIEHLERETGRSPSVLTVARHLGLANTTFRRRFPHIVARLRASIPISNAPGAAPRQVDSDIGRLRQRNRDLTDRLKLAESSIQRLSLDNRALRRQLEQATAVVHLPYRP
ncbi:MAG: hypothetical protein JHC70_03445 [Rhodococcus sp.]|nr:hypothetical protein [Rhodococcus sp. (in: high G+C Gram-positive bacteria)]MBJ7321380.1 hypothetical protein [Rhodococcus sp. (in: high G+C Gram-positive bacteria)]